MGAGDQTQGQLVEVLRHASRAFNASLILEDLWDALEDVLETFVLGEPEASDKATDRAWVYVASAPQDRQLVRFDATCWEAGPVADTSLIDRCRVVQSPMLLPQADMRVSLQPLLSKGQLVGVLGVRLPVAEAEAAHELLVLVAEPLAAALENAHLYWQTQQHASRQLLIHQMTGTIRTSLDVDTILTTTVSLLCQTLGMQQALMRVREKGLHDNAQGADHWASAGPLAAPLADWQALLDALMHQRRLTPQQPFVVNDTDKDPLPEAMQEKAQAVIWAEGIKAWFVQPLPAESPDDTAGLLVLIQRDRPRVWDGDTRQLLEAVAEHVGVALQQAALVDDIRRQRSELAQTLEALQQAQLQLVQSEKMAVLGQFVAGIAHEVNTPLGVVLSNVTTLEACLERLSNNPPAEKLPVLLSTATEVAGMIHMAADRIQETVKNLRNFARLDESDRKQVDVHEGINSTLLLVRGSVPPDVTIETRYAKDLPLLSCYPGLLNQVFLNLIVNALHAVSDVAGDKRLTIETALERDAADGDTLCVRVHDTGSGIAPENLKRVFDPGFTTKGVGVGTGLGLALCYRIIEKHGGIIRLDSTQGEGTCAEVRLPLASQHTQLAANASATGSTSASA